MIYFLYFSWAQLDNLATFFGNIFYHSKFYNYYSTVYIHKKMYSSFMRGILKVFEEDSWLSLSKTTLLR